MPVRHEDDDWIELNKKVVQIDRDLIALGERQTRQHNENVKRMDQLEVTQKEIQSDVAEIKEVMSEVKGVLIGVKSVGKLLAWLLGIVIALQSVYMLFGPTIRKNIGLPNANAQTPAMQGHLDKRAPFDANLPSIDTHPSKE